METNIFKCDDCGREFELDYQLELHRKYMHEPKSAYKCDKCGQEFPLKHQLDNHVSNVKHDPNEKPGRDYHGHRPAEPPRKLY